MKNAEQAIAALRKYLRQGLTCRAETRELGLDSFLQDVSTLFTLRMAAEENWGGSPRTSTFENPFFEHKYQAQRNTGALPLEWTDIEPILNPSTDEPRRTLITHIATHCVEEVRSISTCLRRVLSRNRVLTQVGKVQQLDTSCIRWLMKQPGRSIVEKAGMEQRVMAVVRREQYDTLENRVFKDFLIRSESLAWHYLRDIENKFKEHNVYKTVRDFKLACQWALEQPELREVSALSAFPHPNYVLQQDNHYSVIWNAYGRIIQLSNIAEKLLMNCDLLHQKLLEATQESTWQRDNNVLPSKAAYYHSQLWINPLDGRKEFFDNWSTSCLAMHNTAPISEINRRIRREKDFYAQEGIGVVDLTGNHVFGDILLKAGLHDNAKPRINDRSYPLWDDTDEAVGKKPIQRLFLREIWAVLTDRVHQDAQDEQFRVAIGNMNDYCERILGEYQNIKRNVDCRNLHCRERQNVSLSLNEMVILVPDDCNAVAQEILIQAFAALPRTNVHLLWTSVAMVLGCEDSIVCHLRNEDFAAVIDFRNDNNVMVTKLKYLTDEKSGRLIPQRSMFVKGEQVNTSRYRKFHTDNAMQFFENDICNDVSVICLSGNIPSWFLVEVLERYAHEEDKDENSKINSGLKQRTLWLGKRCIWMYWETSDFWCQKSGAKRFAKERLMRTLYFDELDALWVIGQDTEHERIVQYSLVSADERFAGGASRTFKIPQRIMNIGEGQCGVEFLFHMGELADDTRLHQYKQSLLGEATKHLVPIDGEITVSPGQGIAQTKVTASIFKEPILLDYLHNMKLSDKTIVKMNDELPRSFPPVSAVVEAYREAPYGMLGRYNTVLNDAKYRIKSFIAGELPFDALPSDIFCKTKRRGIQDLQKGESKLHCFDRYNIFGNVRGAQRPDWLTEQEERKLFSALVDNYQKGIDKPKAIRLIAWTYRAEYKPFEKLARKIFYAWSTEVKSEIEGSKTCWRTMLANMLSAEPLWDLLPKLLEVIRNRALAAHLNADDFRLFYNLLQFDENFVEHSGMTCKQGTEIAWALGRYLEKYRSDARTTSYKSTLRCLLYLLRLREKEHYFLRDYAKVVVPDTIDSELCQWMQRTYAMLNTELKKAMFGESAEIKIIRETTWRFLNGAGTLPDIISIMEDN